MNRVLNWVFGSFFRTLGRVLVYIIIGFLVAYALKDTKMPKFNLSNLLFSNVSAATYDFNEVITNSKVYINNYQLTTTNKFYTNIGVNEFKLYSDSVWDYYDVNTPSYAYITVCQAYPSENTVSSTGYFTTNATVYNTSIPCKVFGTDAYPNAVLMHIALQFNLGPSSTTPLRTMCATGATTTLCSLDNSIDINLPRTQEFSLVSYGFSKEPFQYDNASSALINQNQTIINNLGQINTDINGVSNNITNSTSSIINNQNQNKQDIINNQNENTDREIDSQKVCRKKEINYLEATDRGYLSSDGTVNSTGTGAGNFRTTDYIEVSPTSQISRTETRYKINICSYNSNKEFISCTNLNNVNYFYQLPSNVNYIKLSFYIVQAEQSPVYTITNICINGNQAIGDNLSDMNSSINDSDSSGATSDASSFFSNFTTDTHGLTGIITAPLNAINSLTNQSCSPLVLPLPFINQDLTLPCMREIYDEYFGSFMTLYDVITLGIVSYWVMVRIFGLVKDFKNPEHDEIEVVDL